MMPLIEIKVGDELIQRQSGSAANLIRKVSSTTSYVIYFQDGYHTTRREIETSGRWSKLEVIRGTGSRVETSDTVHFRDRLGQVRHRDGEFAYFLAKEHEKIPLNEIHYDTDANEFWHLSPRDVRCGDIVIHGKNRYKVEAVVLATNQIMFGEGKWVSPDKILVDSDDRCYYISELDEVGVPEVPVLKSGDKVSHMGWDFEVSYVKDGVARFLKGGEFPLSKIQKEAGVWFIDKKYAFWDMEFFNGSLYTCVSGKNVEELTERVRYAGTKGFKLWGPTMVKGDYYAQALRK